MVPSKTATKSYNSDLKSINLDIILFTRLMEKFCSPIKQNIKELNYSQRVIYVQPLFFTWLLRKCVQQQHKSFHSSKIVKANKMQHMAAYQSRASTDDALLVYYLVLHISPQIYQKHSLVSIGLTHFQLFFVPGSPVPY